MKNLLLIIIVFLSLTSAAQVTSVTGTTDQIIASGSTGTVTLSLPQSIGITSSPRFSNLAIGGAIIPTVGFYNRRNITGSTTGYSNFTEAVIQNDVTITAFGYRTALATQAASFTLSSLQHFTAAQGTIGVGSAITTQLGFNVDASLVGAGTNIGFRGALPSGANRWNLYMSGTGQNYLAGMTGFGKPVPTQMIDVVGNGQFTGSLAIGSIVNSNISFYNKKNITGGTGSYGNFTQAVIQSDVTNTAVGYRSLLSTQAASFTLPNLVNFDAVQGTTGAGSAVTNQFGFRVDANMTGATNNYGFRGDISAGANRWNLYMNGTADNYLAGNLGIGTTNPTEKLSVNGNIRAKEIRVEASPWPDYVFHENYSLLPLSELEKFIKTNRHLPEIPSAKETEENGVNLGEMNASLLKKVEELTLYLIAQDKNFTKQLANLQKEIDQLKSE